MSDDAPKLPNNFEEAERFQRLFVKPMVDAVKDSVGQQLQPIVSGQRKLFAMIEEQAAKDTEQDERLTNLEGSQNRAMVGWGVFATGLSIALSAGWNWIITKFKGAPILLVCVAMVLAGCKPDDGPDVIMRVLDPSLEQYSVMWQNEIGRRVHHALGIIVHGGDFVQGQWIVGTNEYASGEHVKTAQEVVTYYQNLYPDRTIVLISCNTGHVPLGIPGVYYAKASIWCVPDRNVTDPAVASKLLDKIKLYTVGEAQLSSRWETYPEVVGNIFEFVRE